MKDVSRDGLRTWIEVSRSAIAHNIKMFRSLIPKRTKLLAVVKSNAYGHSLIDFAREAARLKVDMLGVDSIVEGLALRREGVTTPILVLGYTLSERVPEAMTQNISVALSHIDQISAFVKAAGKRRLSVHVKVDTGMHRQGFLPAEREALLAALKKHRAVLSVDGLFTHFAAAKNPSFKTYTNQQIGEFEEWRAAFAAAGFSPIAHAGATGGALVFPEAHYDMVRIGIGLYGLYPSSETKAAVSRRFPLLPVLSWKTVLSEVKRLKKGMTVGYDCAETLWRDTTIAVCPVGYWHGYPRALSSVGHVLVRGRRARVLGRVSMDMIVVDVTDVPGVCAGDVVTLIGTDGADEVSAAELSGLMDGSYYELLTRLNPLMKRVYR